jgi:hypothetical protein
MVTARMKFWLPFLGLVGAVVLGSQWLSTGGEEPGVVAPAADRSRPPAGAAAPREPEFVLPRRTPATPPPEEQARDIFKSKSWYVPPPPPPPEPVVAPAPPPPPKAPPLPFQFIGWMDDGDQLRAFLSRGEQVYTAAEGAQLDADYRIEKVDAAQITFLYLPLSEKQVLPLSGNTGYQAAAPVPAPPVSGSGIGTAAAAAAAGVAGKMSPEEIDSAAVAMRLKQQQIRDRARQRAQRR